jgi:F-type H+-transporting ATPase subunit delta
MGRGEYDKVAKRYARALFDVTQPDSFDVVGDQLAYLATLWEQSADFREAMINPRIADDSRIEVLGAVVTASGSWKSEPTRRCLETIVGRRKAPILPALVRTFSELIEEFRRNLTLEVTLAQPVAADTIAELKKQLSSSLGGEVRLSVKHDPELLGGLTIRLADKLLDRSVAGTLARMAQQLTR